MNSNEPIETYEERDAFQYQTTRCKSPSRRTATALARMAGRLSKRKNSKDHARERLVELIDLLMPLAQKEGRAQTLALGGARHAILAGGIRGESLASASLYEYLRLGLPAVLDGLEEEDPEGLTGDGWLSIYRNALEQVAESQRGKLASFLEAFHRFIVIIGCEPLPHSILGRGRPVPPCARIVWPEELEAAIEHVHRSAAAAEIKRQAILGLRLGYHVPIRIHELWCIRLIDFNERAERAYLVIAPRRRDGSNKSRWGRRQVDLRDRELIGLLLDQKRLRLEQGGQDEDVLLGVSNEPDGRLEELVTTRLMNAALKAATGDRAAAYHDLRHGCVSRAVEQVLEVSDVY